MVLPNQLSVYRSIEGLIQHFELIMTNRQWQTPVDEVYAAIESPNGELGYLRGGRRQRRGVSRADAAAVVHPFRHLSRI